MSFQLVAKKGLSQCFRDTRLTGDPLHFHISEVDAGQASHPPHEHDGTEAIYLLDGEATLTIGDEQVVLKAGDGVIFDPLRRHGLVNTGAGRNRYMVIIRH